MPPSPPMPMKAAIICHMKKTEKNAAETKSARFSTDKPDQKELKSMVSPYVAGFRERVPARPDRQVRSCRGVDGVVTEGLETSALQ